MGWMGSLGNLVQQFATGQVTPEQAEQHFDQIAGAAPSSTVAEALAGALRSDQTPPFAQLAAQLFNGSSGEQKAGMLNSLISAAGPMLPQLIGNSPVAGGLMQLLASSSGGAVSAEDAQQVSPEAVQQIAEHAHAQDPSIIDRVSSLYAEHPTVVKSLGAAVLAIAVSKMTERGSK